MIIVESRPRSLKFADQTLCDKIQLNPAKELVYELVEYLSRRYPSSFRITRQATSPVPSVCGVSLGWGGEMPIRSVEVVETGTTYDLSSLETLEGTDMGEAAMEIVTGL